MAQALETFFAAWSETDRDRRADAIASVMADSFSYSDPRSGGRIHEIGGLSEYVGMFSASAPGWTARVEAASTVNGFVRARVAFEGIGPDGRHMAQHGTYFADLDDAGRIVTLAGFVGEREE